MSRRRGFTRRRLYAQLDRNTSQFFRRLTQTDSGLVPEQKIMTGGLPKTTKEEIKPNHNGSPERNG